MTSQESTFGIAEAAMFLRQGMGVRCTTWDPHVYVKYVDDSVVLYSYGKMCNASERTFSLSDALNPWELFTLEYPDFVCASKSCICSICDKEYGKHPTYYAFEDLNILCDGSVVKL